MLKRLLSRDTKGKVAKRVKESLDSDAQAPALAPEADPDPTPQVVHKPDPTPPVVRKAKAKSMRDSDIKDEQGRSAEQIAAEAAEEFDIMGIARRVNEMVEADGPAPKTAPTPAPATADAPAQAAISAPVAVPTPAPAAPQPDPALLVEAGHIFRPGPKKGSAEATALARDVYWSELGVSDPEFVEYDDPADILGQPAWPTSRPQYRMVRTESSLILATEGLSDPFEDFQGPADRNGYGQELFIEVPGLQAATDDLIRNSWVFRALEYVARVCAHSKGITDLLDEHGVMSLDLPGNCAPRDWIVPGIAEPAGALLDVPMPRGRNLIPDMPLSPVRVVPMTLIFPEELEDCIVGGPKERAALVNDLLTTGQGHKTDTRRASLR